MFNPEGLPQKPVVPKKEAWQEDKKELTGGNLGILESALGKRITVFSGLQMAKLDAAMGANDRHHIYEKDPIKAQKAPNRIEARDDTMEELKKLTSDQDFMKKYERLITLLYSVDVIENVKESE
jgi:hypothetical protein